MVAGDTRPRIHPGALLFILYSGVGITAKIVDALRVTPGVPCRLPMTILRGAGGTMVPPGP